MTTSPQAAALIAAACPDINTLGSAFYFIPETTAVGKSHGLDGFRFYILGRGGVLGDVEAAVVTSAFAWWNHDLIEKMWNSAQEKMSPRDAGRLYLKCAHELGRAKFSSVGGLDAFCMAAEAVVGAVDPAGYALFAGLAAEPLAEDIPARTMQLLAILREFRGCAHIVAVLASGLSPKLAHAIKRPEMVKSFGWGEDPVPFTDTDRANLEAAEVLTDQLVTPAYSVLDDAGAKALLTGIASVKAALA
jgi:hypothetical protein